MSSQPQWSPLDDETSDLLSLVATGPMSGHAQHEWDVFQAALLLAADSDNRVDPNQLRERVRDQVAPRRVGAFVNRALARGLIEWRGDWVVSTDTAGRNAGRPVRRYVLVGEAS